MEPEDDIDDHTPCTTQSKKEKKRKKLEKKLLKGRPEQASGSTSVESSGQQDVEVKKNTLSTIVEAIQLQDNVSDRIEAEELKNMSADNTNSTNTPKSNAPLSSINNCADVKAENVQIKSNTAPKKQIKKKTTKGASSITSEDDDTDVVSDLIYKLF